MIKAIQQVIVRKILAYYINCFITEIIDVFSSVMNDCASSCILSWQESWQTTKKPNVTKMVIFRFVSKLKPDFPNPIDIQSHLIVMGHKCMKWHMK